jgi:uncharacterized protein (TIGR02594 family)
MADAAPPWLNEMRAITGLSEKPGTADEPKILAMASYIAKQHPEMANYCAQYIHDSIPWCGLCEAYCMTRAGIRPPFGKTDTDRFLWARAWADDPEFPKLSKPKLGCVVVMTRSGGGHVTTYESDAGSNIKCRGGNQSDAITLASYPKSSVIAYVWPKASVVPPPVPPDPEPEPTELPTLRKGATGPSVAYMQSLIPKWIDGDFGSTTEALLKEFQRSKHLIVDGICGPDTWASLGASEVAPPIKPPSEAGWIHDVTATVFGGAADNERSAYAPYELLNDTDFYLSLPDRFEGARPRVGVKGPNGISVVADIMDVGPWLTDDPYWMFNRRPTAEMCYLNKTPLPSGPNKGKIPSNPAGIDLSPALAKAVGISGKGKVSWRLVT